MALVKCPECSKDISDQAVCCPSCGYRLRPDPAVSEIRAFRKRILIGGLIVCVVCLPVGIAMNLPYVWVLSIVGIVVSTVKLLLLSRK
jgi:hypothetical protein